ncbi:MAG: hypothetical protein ABJP34_03515 [Erythrobacter sp.]
MDTLRGTFDRDTSSGEADDFDLGQEDIDTQLPPASIGQDERRMQVRAYNHWASLLGERNFPSIEELEPENLPDFSPFSVLLDFSVGIEDPAVRFLGKELAEECDADEDIDILSDIPSRSLLSRITDHYMQILANQAPIGFEAEFVNQRGATILYRGILLPFSSDDESIDFIYGVINWKELADQATTDDLMLEIDQSLALEDEDTEDEADISEVIAEKPLRAPEPLAAWADSPSAEAASNEDAFEAGFGAANSGSDDDLPQPAFGEYNLDDDGFNEAEDEEEGEAGYSFASLTDHIAAPADKPEALDLDSFEAIDEPAGASDEGHEVPLDLGNFDEASLAEGYGESEVSQTGALAAVDADNNFDETLDEDAGLYDTLASARELAHNASSSEDRSRKALYAAVGRAYDFSLAAAASPEEYDELIADNGLSVQERAPMTPIVKLVFGADYDKTRLTEYAAVLGHAQRAGLGQGDLADFLSKADGGLKGVVAEERRIRAEESGKPAKVKDAPSKALAKKLRKLDGKGFDTLDNDGAEFAVVMIRRDENGVTMLGEIADDIALVERVGRKLLK